MIEAATWNKDTIEERERAILAWAAEELADQGEMTTSLLQPLGSPGAANVFLLP